MTISNKQSIMSDLFICRVRVANSKMSIQLDFEARFYFSKTRKNESHKKPHSMHCEAFYAMEVLGYRPKSVANLVI